MKKTITKISEMEKTPLMHSKLGLDSRDNVIISMLLKDPFISQEKIAGELKISQPSVSARIRKLQEKGILNTVNGVNFRNADLCLGKIDVKCTDTKEILNSFKDCPFFVNGLITSGRYNLCLFFVSTDLKRLEGIVNYHLRGNAKVMDMELNIVIGTAEDFVLPVKLGNSFKCDHECLKLF